MPENDAAENDATESEHKPPSHRAEGEPTAEPGGGVPHHEHGRHEALTQEPAEPEPDREPEETDPEVVAPPVTEAEPEAAPEPATVISAAGIGVRSRDGWIFRDVDLRARAGEVVAVVGPSGSGRTTLLLALAARLRVDGELRVLGEDVAAARASRSVLRRVAVARAAEAITLDPHLSLARNARDAADWTARPVTTAADLLQQWRDRTGLPLRGDRPVEELAPLERLVAELAIALVGGPDVVVVDDLDAGLTEPERARAWALVQQAADDGPTLIVSALDPPPDADQIIRLGAMQEQEARA